MARNHKKRFTWSVMHYFTSCIKSWPILHHLSHYIFTLDVYACISTNSWLQSTHTPWSSTVKNKCLVCRLLHCIHAPPVQRRLLQHVTGRSDIQRNAGWSTAMPQHRAPFLQQWLQRTFLTQNTCSRNRNWCAHQAFGIPTQTCEAMNLYNCYSTKFLASRISEI